MLLHLHIQRQVETAAMSPQVVDACHLGEPFDVLETPICTYNVLNVFVGQEALCTLPRNLVHCIDEKDLASSLLRFVRAADQDTGLHRGVVEEVWPQANYTLDHIMGNQLIAHALLLISEQDAVREENGTSTRPWLETLDNVLQEGIVSTALRWRAVDVASPWISRPCITIPLLDRVWRISQHDVKLHEPIALDEGWMRQGIATHDMKVLDAVQEEVHAPD